MEGKAEQSMFCHISEADGAIKKPWIVLVVWN